jgi:polyisoprenoid-binding protein YceI
VDNNKSVAGNASPLATGACPVFTIDPRTSRFTVQAFATGMLSMMGHNPTIGIRTFHGEVEFDPETCQAGKFRLAVQSASLFVQDDLSDKDRREMERLMKDEILEVGRYPEITYEASRASVSKIDAALFAATIDGALSLHGATRAEPLSVRILSMGDMLRASGEFNLKQSDYQIKPISVAGGALKLKDELKFSFEMVARRQE